MKKFGMILAALMVLALVSGILLGGCSAAATDKLKVVTSTSLMEYVAKKVGGDHVQVTNIVPPSQHPGNFDVKPGDIENLSKADLFLLHGWPGEGYADKLIASAANPDLVVFKASVNGNTMIPSVQAQLVDKVTQALSENDSENAAAYQKAADAYKKTIADVETEIRSKLTVVAGTGAVASARQADFLQWAGFNVAGSFTSPQELNPQKVKELVDAGKAGAAVVVNNLQDGKDAGKAIAQELNVPNLNLSNFPGGFENTETWEKAIRYNVDILLEALDKK
jgi:ABC-type Zn uptake system ZnuABC Zn-binding protein ZnuA